MLTSIDILVAVQRDRAGEYYQNLSANQDFSIQIVSDTGDTLEILSDRDRHVDILIIDNSLPGVFDLITDLRHTYPRLLIILVDEEADFGLPGHADDISTEPFTNQDLEKRIRRLMSDRRLETLRADSLPAVRQFAKRLRTAPPGEGGKYQAAVSASFDLNYDYVAFYRLESIEPLKIELKAQEGPKSIQAVAPKQGSEDDIIGWVAKNRQIRISSPEDTLNHPLVARGRLGAAACIPVIFSGTNYGVLVACREQPGSISQENVLMLELISTQLAAAISKERVD